MSFSSQHIATMVEALGSVRFSKVLLESLSDTVAIDHMALVHFEPERVRYITSASTHGVHIPEQLQQLYLSLYYRLDPNINVVKQLNSGDEVLVRRLSFTDINDMDYQRLWYEHMDINDRLSVITQADKGIYSLNLYKKKTAFTEKAYQQIKSQADVLSAFAVKHTRLSGSLSSFQTRESQINDLIERLAAISTALTAREQQVCARILIGMTSQGIALDLSISPDSVATYRKRAYTRLNISSQNELFALCLIHSS